MRGRVADEEDVEAMRARPLVIVHDREASRVPWEVLRIGTTHPALGGGLSRRYASDTLSVARWREDLAASDPLRVLLIVDPTRDLPGAAAEGEILGPMRQQAEEAHAHIARQFHTVALAHDEGRQAAGVEVGRHGVKYSMPCPNEKGVGFTKRCRWAYSQPETQANCAAIMNSTMR